MDVRAWVTLGAAIAAAAGAVGLATRRGPLLGKDGRVSTSRTFALLWSLVLAWMLVTLLVYALADGRGMEWFGGPDGPLDPITPLYLLLLGGPYLAHLGAKEIVSARVSGGRLAKPRAAAGEDRLRDLVHDDTGRTDLADFQYVLFNAVALAYVVVPFLCDIRRGLPDLPAEIALLTGAPAAAYLANKAVSRPVPVITAVTPGPGVLVLSGGGFVPAGPLPDPVAAAPAVLVDGSPVPVLAAAPDRVEAAWEPPPGGVGAPVSVQLVTAAQLLSNVFVRPPDAPTGPADAPRPAPDPVAAPGPEPVPAPLPVPVPAPEALPLNSPGTAPERRVAGGGDTGPEAGPGGISPRSERPGP
ncbi:hypothetical protein [Streptomyces sp. NPDC097619]|uniref:hypothetical protein n=1 Tax=Streptomyces sp. NPDC097619 TaxID=3157228 RepID=UPI00333129BF